MVLFSIAIAFLLGFLVRQIGLPPLVGFLGAGFLLRAFGVEGGEGIQTISELGVTLLLFTIGLKLDLRTLFEAEVWAGTSIHLGAMVVGLGLVMAGAGALGLAPFDGLGLGSVTLIAFALGFSSTVFAVKVLEDKGETTSLHGRLAIGILIMQDVIAVVFLTLSTGKVPSPWALLLLGLPLLRRPIWFLLQRSGHGELLILLGLLLAIGGAGTCEAVGVKPDVGALVLGIIVGPHAKAGELARALFGFKDLFLVGFFLSIGLSGLPGLDGLVAAVLLVLLIPAKTAAYFLLLTRFRLRARTALLASLSLANYSEFGLIVGAVATANGWLSPQWVVIVAIALSLTFVLASPLNAWSYRLYSRWAGVLARFERPDRHPKDQPVDTGDAEILIFGMGRIGTGAYDAMRERYGDRVIGLDYDERVVERHRHAGRNVVRDDATDRDFWHRIRPGRVRLVMLAMPDQSSNLFAAQRLAESGFRGMVGATAQFDDDAEALRAAGVHSVFNFYAETGAGFAHHVCHELGDLLSAPGPTGG